MLPSIFGALPYFRAQKGFSDLHVFQLWNQPFLQGALLPFSGEGYSETRIWVGMLIPTAASFLLGPCNKQSEEIFFFFNNELGELLLTVECHLID